MREVIIALIIAGSISLGGLWLGLYLKAEGSEYNHIPNAWLSAQANSEKTQ